MPTVPVLPSSSVSSHPTMKRTQPHWKTTSSVWRTAKRRSSSALVTVWMMSRLPHSLSVLSRRAMRSSTWPNPLMSTLSKVKYFLLWNRRITSILSSSRVRRQALPERRQGGCWDFWWLKELPRENGEEIRAPSYLVEGVCSSRQNREGRCLTTTGELTSCSSGFTIWMVR